MTAEETVDEQPTLRTVGRRRALHRYLASVWRSRSFIPRQANADPMLDVAPSVLQRITWLLLPFAEALLWFAMLALVLNISWGDATNPLTFVLIGVLVFAYTARVVERSAGALERSRSLLSSFDFPQLLVPLSTLWRQSGAFLMTLYALVLIVLVVPPTGTLGLSWLLLPVLFVLHFLFNAGLAFLSARIGQWLPFTRLWLPWLLRVWMLASCAVWPLSTMTKLGDAATAITQHNPLFMLIDMYRAVMLEGASPKTATLMEFGAWAVVLPLVGLLVFWLGETRHARR